MFRHHFDELRIQMQTFYNESRREINTFRSQISREMAAFKKDPKEIINSFQIETGKSIKT